MDINIIDEVLTLMEAVELYNLKSPAALRQRLEREKAFTKGVDFRKTTGKRGEWLITRKAMDRVYGKDR